jgi:hypothetical protein
VVPSIAQQLQSLRNVMAETIIPALPAEAAFAQEQAGLMLATLDLLSDVQAHAYRYEVSENAEYRQLLEALRPFVDDPSEGEEIRAALGGRLPPAPDALVSFEVVAAQNKAFKALTGRLSESLLRESSDRAHRARALVLDTARRQGEREQAWFRMTGFPDQAKALAELFGSPGYVEGS